MALVKYSFRMFSLLSIKLSVPEDCFPILWNVCSLFIIQILTCILKRTKNNLQPDHINFVASKAHGFVGADLNALCKEGQLNVMARSDRTYMGTGLGPGPEWVTVYYVKPSHCNLCGNLNGSYTLALYQSRSRSHSHVSSVWMNHHCLRL